MLYLIKKYNPKNPIKGYEERIPGDSMEGVFKRFKIITQFKLRKFDRILVCPVSRDFIVSLSLKKNILVQKRHKG